MINVLKFFYPRKSLKRKILDIVDSIKLIILPVCKEKFWVDWYGAYYIDPKNLVIWICVESDTMKSTLESNVKLKSKLINLLVINNYPESARPFVQIGFESQETVNRESNGSWYNHFK